MVNPCKNKLLALHLQSISFGEERIATLAQLVEQRIRNAQVKGSSPFAGSIWNSDVLAFSERCRSFLFYCPSSSTFSEGVPLYFPRFPRFVKRSFPPPLREGFWPQPQIRQ